MVLLSPIFQREQILYTISLLPDLTGISGKATNEGISNPANVTRISVYKEPGVPDSNHCYGDRDKGLYDYADEVCIDLDQILRLGNVSGRGSAYGDEGRRD
jgi:hypothetical protein